MKLCYKCGKEKFESDFSKDSATRDGLQNSCKECQSGAGKEYRRKNPERVAVAQRAYRLKFRAKYPVLAAKRDREHSRKWRAEHPESERKAQRRQTLRNYGLTEESFSEILCAQSGKCAICREDLKDLKQHIDHCHATGKVRGILCAPCNFGMGSFKDSPLNLRLAADYLEQFSASAEKTNKQKHKTRK